MKKLMKTVVASAVALIASGAFAELPSPESPVGFEDLTANRKYNLSDFVSMNDSGGSTGSRYWFAITNNSQEASAELVTVNNDLEQGNYISIEAGAPLYRTINAVSDGYGASFSDSSATAEVIGSDGIYLDTMVKFTVSSEEFKSSDLEDNVDKLAITCYSSEEESNKTNILVRAGYVGSTVTATNYFLNLPSDFDVDVWHRLTVRAIADVGSSSAPVGFAIYLDEELLKYGLNVDAGEQTYVGSLNAAVQQNLYNSETHALLPSLVASGGNLKTLTAVGFKGTGSVDDIQFTEDPGFIDEGETVTIAWDAGVATYTVVDSNSKTLVNGEATSGVGSTNLTLDAGVTYLTVTATYATNYTNGTWTVTGEGAEISGSTFTVANGATLNIVSMLPKFEVNGVNYGSFANALDAAVLASTATVPYTPVTITLLGDYSGDTMTFVGGSIILDLAGKTITADEQAAIINTSTALIITNSTPEVVGHIVAPTPEDPEDDAFAILVGDGTSTKIYGGYIDGIIELDGESEMEDLVELYGGYFLDSAAQESTDNFYLKDCAKATVTYANDDYFQVGGAEPAPTTYEVTWTLTGGTTTAISGDDFEENDEIVFTADSGKTLSYVEIDGVEDSTAYGASSYTYTVGAADAELVVTFTEPAPTTYEVTWTLTGGTTTATSGDDFEENDTIVFTAESGKTLSFVSIDGTEIADTSVYGASSYTYTVGTADAVLEVTFTGGSGWEPDPSKIDPAATAADTYSELAGTALATANAKKLTEWAEENKVDFADVTGSAASYVDAYLLNCAPAEVEDAKDEFKATITVNADGTVTVTAPGDYNVTPTIQGKQSLSDAEWHTKQPGDKFFRAVLEL